MAEAMLLEHTGKIGGEQPPPPALADHFARSSLAAVHAGPGDARGVRTRGMDAHSEHTRFAGKPGACVGFVSDASLGSTILHSPPAGSDNIWEVPGRVRCALKRLTTEGLLDVCTRIPSRPATLEELTAVHSAAHVDAVEATHTKGRRALGEDPDLYVCPGTAQAARLAAGCAAAAARAVAVGDSCSAFALVRPPGHHAGVSTVGGFCFYNNVAVAARAAQAAGAKRVAIFDWDVHHGNGTQEIFYSDPSVLFISVHRCGEDFYPYSGPVGATGTGKGAGYNVNIPFPDDGLGGSDFGAALAFVVIPILSAFAPDVLLISAGFDAAAGDPLGGCKAHPPAFASMATACAAVCPRLVVVLEGGYDETAIADCAEATFRAMLAAAGDVEDAPPGAHARGGPQREHARAHTVATLRAVREAQRGFWKAAIGGGDAAFDDWAGREDAALPRFRLM